MRTEFPHAALDRWLTTPSDDCYDQFFEKIIDMIPDDAWNDMEEFIDTDLFIQWFDELTGKLEYDDYDMDEDTGEMKEYYSPGITQEQMTEYLIRRFYCYKAFST